MSLKAPQSGPEAQPNQNGNDLSQTRKMDMDNDTTEKVNRSTPPIMVKYSSVP